MKKHILFSALAIILLSSCAIQKRDLKKPVVFEFGSSMAEMKQSLTHLSDSMETRLDEPVQLPTAKNSQSQLDVFGFMYAGKKRNVELIFADDALDIVWVLTEANEEDTFINQFRKMYGEPTHITAEATFFLNDGTAVRNKPHEVLFLSERLKEPYSQFLQSQE